MSFDPASSANRIWQRRGFVLVLWALGLLLLFRLRDDIQYSFQTHPKTLPVARSLAPSWMGPQSTFATMPSATPLRYHQGALLQVTNSDRAWEVWTFLDPKSLNVLIHPYRRLDPTLRLKPWEGRLERLSQDPWRDNILAYAQEQHWFDVSIDAIALQSQSDTSSTAWPLLEGGTYEIPSTERLRALVTFPKEIRVLLPKQKHPTLAAANQSIQQLHLVHAPGVETSTGFGYVVRLPEDKVAEQQAWQRIRAAGWPYENQRVETYSFLRAQVHLTPQGLLLPGPQQLPQPTQYTPNLDHTALVAVEAATTLLPWARLHTLSVEKPAPSSENVWVLRSEETPASLRIWLWPLTAGLVALMLIQAIVFFRSFRRTAHANL